MNSAARRVQAFRWLVIICALILVFVTNLGNAQPDAVERLEPRRHPGSRPWS